MTDLDILIDSVLRLTWIFQIGNLIDLDFDQFGNLTDVRLLKSCRALVFWPNPRREIYNLGMVSGPVLLKIKGQIELS